MGDEVEIRTEDLSPGSREKVLVKCDYCGREFYVAWDKRQQSAKNVDKDCCSSKECTGKKAQEAIQNIYGVDYPVHIPGVQEKIEATNMEKYGCKNPFGNKEIQQKIKDAVALIRDGKFDKTDIYKICNDNCYQIRLCRNRIVFHLNAKR